MKRPEHVIEIVLQPGDFYFGDASTRIRTLLGSCVSMTLWHPSRLIGGMCHYMLPSRSKQSSYLDGKYADEAIALFLLEIARHDTRPEEYQVKLFGGGNMFPGHSKRQDGINVANLNIVAAQTLAARHNLNLAAQDLGCTGHRNVIFDICSGHVWVRHQRLADG